MESHWNDGVRGLVVVASLVRRNWRVSQDSQHNRLHRVAVAVAVPSGLERESTNPRCPSDGITKINPLFFSHSLKSLFLFLFWISGIGFCTGNPTKGVWWTATYWMKYLSAWRTSTASKTEDGKPPSLSTDPICEVPSSLLNPFLLLLLLPISETLFFHSDFHVPQTNLSLPISLAILLGYRCWNSPTNTTSSFAAIRLFSRLILQSWLLWRNSSPTNPKWPLILRSLTLVSWFSCVSTFFIVFFLSCLCWWWCRECSINWVTLCWEWLKLSQIRLKISEEF